MYLHLFAAGSLFFACHLPAADGQLIGGIGHVGFRVSDLEKTRAYYTGRLGLPQVYDQKDAAGKTTLAVFQVSRGQFLEFSPGSPVGFTHLAFVTSELESLHQLVETLGLKPPELRTGRDRTRNFSIQDPDKHRIEFVQYEPDSLQAQADAKFVSNQAAVWGIHHIGLPSVDAGAARAFFHGKLNFQAYIELLPATEPVHIGMTVGDDSPPAGGHDPDGVPIEMVGVR